MFETLSFPEAAPEEEPAEEKQDFFSKVNILAKFRIGVEGRERVTA